ncbi:MAG: cryptochrome/photolyase family protein [Candidatus Nanopelagicales bacterium]
MTTRWLFADQLGPHFTDDLDTNDHVLIIVAENSFARRRYHRAKVHLILSAVYHRAAELGERCSLIHADTFRAGFSAYCEQAGVSPEQVSVCAPTSYGARRLCAELGVEVLPARGFVTSERDFDDWASTRKRKRLLMEDFYRHVRRRTGVLMEGDEPVGGQWNYDADNRKPPPRGQPTLGLAEPWWPVEDEWDKCVREQLDSWATQMEFLGRDGPRKFAVTREEALRVLADFIANRLATFGPFEDAAMTDDWVMSHSLLSAPMNMGLLDPMECVQAVADAYVRGEADIASAEGFIRQVMGWRDYVWHLYWHLGEGYVGETNALAAHQPLPQWWRELDSDAVEAACVRTALEQVRDHGWNHHILRLMVLGNWALQRGYDPVETTEWFTSVFVDAYPWVMAANVAGMALYADGGVMATKPYAAGGAYINRMTNFCGGCVYAPTKRVGPQACPVTAGYWWFIDRNAERLAGNPRMGQPLRGRLRLADLDELVAAETDRGDSPP